MLCKEQNKSKEENKMKYITEIKGKEDVETIILPGKKHGNYSYPDLEVSTELFTTCDMWTGTVGRPGTVEQMKEVAAIMPTLRQFIDYVNLLRSRKVFYGNGKKVDEERIKQIFDEIVNGREKHFGEVFDGQFKMKNYFTKEIQMKYNIIKNDGSLQEIIETLDDHLGKINESLLARNLRRRFKDDFIENWGEKRIDAKYWLENATAQGLPPPNNPEDSEKGTFYWPPRHGGIINFGNLYGGFTCQESPYSCRGEYNTVERDKLKVVRPMWIKK